MNFEEWVWSDKLISGNDALDFRHQSLLNIVNDLIRIHNESNGEPSSLLVEVPLDELFKFAAHHFADEESVMKQFNYSKLVDHHELHIQFVIELINLKIRFDKDENIIKDLIEFLFNWRNKHIQIKDKEAMAHCR